MEALKITCPATLAELDQAQREYAAALARGADIEEVTTDYQRRIDEILDVWEFERVRWTVAAHE